MPIYTAPLRDLRFVIHELLELQNHSNLPGFENATPDLIDAVLEEGGKLCQEVLQPLNQPGDLVGCKLENGVVTTPPGFKEAYAAYVDGGWSGLNMNPEYGGQGLPYVLGTAMSEMMVSANLSFTMYSGLTHGAVAAIENHGADDLKAVYLPKLTTGEWTGTMDLTEPHCGTDLGMLRTKAEPQPDGSYRVTGSKIFISAGDHDMAENIIHLVLARIPGAPDGTKGISLFLVPKILVNEDGSLGKPNNVTCGALEHKMGIKASATCVLNYDQSLGYLVGEENKGLQAMFTMMNAARLNVGVQGYALSEVAYQNAAAYAKDRLQGRSLTGPKNPDGPADPIIVHADVRRMLLGVRAFNEAARALALWTSLRIDLWQRHPDEEVRQAADDFVALVTPVIKGVLTDYGFAGCVQAQQCFGGHGYIHEWGAEQFVRDARISQIYEGTNGIQALDLVGRKLAANGGRAVRAFFAEVDAFVAEHKDDADMAAFTGPLGEANGHLQQATGWFVEHGMANPDNAGAGAYDYMTMFGLVAMGYMWARMAKVAQTGLARAGDSGGDDDFYNTKLVTGRFYMERILPDTTSLLSKVKAGSATVMALAADAF